MTKAIRNFAILGLVISLMAACSNGQISIDGGKPDEYSVVARSGLVIPEAGTGLREPAAAGSEIKDADAAQRLAKRALLGADTQAVGSSELDQRFAPFQDIDIGQRLDAEAETGALGQANDNFIQKRLRSIQRPSASADGSPLALEEETRILNSKGIQTSSDGFVVSGHSLQLMSLGEPKYFDPRDIIRGL